jgi:hypothetical protein
VKNILVTVLALALAAAGLAAWLMRADGPAGQVLLPKMESSVDARAAESLSPTGEAGLEDDPGPPESLPPAKLIRHGVANEQELENATIQLPRSANEETDRMIRRTEKALGGDVDELIELTRLIRGCRRMEGGEDQLQRRLDRMAQFAARNPDAPVMPGRGGSVEYQSFEDLEADMWAQFDRCQLAKEVLDESLYEQVSRLAQSGLPSARYLYAVWPPDQGGLIAVDTLEMLEYQSLALEYTWMNMQERNPLGLLAMAQSYSSRRWPLFTPANPIQGQAFTLAAMKCGIDNEWLEARSVDFGQGFNRFQSENTVIPSLDEDAAILAERFCPLPAGDE